MHFIVLGVVFLILLFGIIAALKQDNNKLVLPMIFSVTFISVLVGAIGIAVVEKYTKKVKLIKVDNRRYLSQEKISYFGTVKNTGKYPVGKVYISIKLVNAGHVTGKAKAEGGGFYKASGLGDFFGSGAGKLYNKPQTIEKEFVIARNLKPGESARFRVTFNYPGYFKNVSHFIKVYGH